MNRKLLLISNSTMRGESYLGWCKEIIKSFCKRHNINDVLFIPYAGVSLSEHGIEASYNAYEEKVRKVYNELGINLHSIHHEENPIKAVYEATSIAVGGGNTFCLVEALHRLNIMKAIRDKAIKGMPYMGWSAGSNVAGPTLSTTNDMPIVFPHSFDCMSLIPFQINPHYTDYFDPKHGGETRDDRIKEYIMVNPTATVAAIREATALNLENGQLKLIGRDNPMKIFHERMELTKEYSIKDDINFLLNTKTND